MNDPDLEILTDRLRLILLPPSRAEEVSAFMRTNALHFARWEPARPEGYHQSGEWAARLKRDRRAFEHDEQLRLWITLRETGTIAGWIHFSGIARGPFQGCRLGYGLGAEFEGQGLMFEALSAALDFAGGALGLHRIEANHLPENERSARLLGRLGFVVEGRAKDYLKIAGAWRDHVLTSRTFERD